MWQALQVVLDEMISGDVWPKILLHCNLKLYIYFYVYKKNYITIVHQTHALIDTVAQEEV